MRKKLTDEERHQRKLESNRRYHARNRDKEKTYRESHKEEKSITDKAYYESHKEEIKAGVRNYYHENPEKVKSYREENRNKRNTQKKQWGEQNQEHVTEYRKTYYIEKHDEILQYSREYYHKNREERAEKSRQWRLNNPEKLKQQGINYRKNNPDKINAKVATRRARKKNAFIEKVNRMDIYDRDHGICGICGKPIDLSFKAPHPQSLTLDHVIPLSKGGKHEKSNIQVAHFSCNSSKGNRLLSTSI